MAESKKVSRENRQAVRKKKIDSERHDLFVASYVKHKYPIMYKQATNFYNQLREKNPQKKDLRKLDIFCIWANNQGETEKMFDLKVQLMGNKDINCIKAQSKTQGNELVGEISSQGNDPVIQIPEPSSSSEDLITDEQFDHILNGLRSDVNLNQPAGEISGQGNDPVIQIPEPSLSLADMITDEQVDHILNELRGDVDLNRIMETIEEQVLYDEYEMDIDISDDDRLQDELL